MKGMNTRQQWWKNWAYHEELAWLLDTYQIGCRKFKDKGEKNENYRSIEKN
jgi:hypothetical protein